MVRIVGTCRACKKDNIVWITVGHIVSLTGVPCEHCGSHDRDSRKKGNKIPAAACGIAWRGDVFEGMEVGRNYTELARPTDLVI